MHIYMSRHGESLNNVKNIIGGDCHISKEGHKYSSFLSKYFNSTGTISNLSVWTSSLKRTIETASNINSNPKIWKNLDEINSGDFDGLVLDNIKLYYPELYKNRNNDKLNQNYPNGENYLDLQKRVTKVLKNIDMNKNDTLLIVAHKAVCRVIYSHFTQNPLSKCTNIDINLHTIYKLDNNKFISIPANLKTT